MNTEHLHHYLAACQHRPFDAVEHHCAGFVAGAIYAATGVRPLNRLGMTMPINLRGVAQILENCHGVAGLAKLLFGRDCVPPLLASEGDVLIKDGGIDGDTLGICTGSQAVFVTEAGLQAHDLSECKGCWKLEWLA